jgi:hypothetical protein
MTITNSSIPHNGSGGGSSGGSGGGGSRSFAETLILDRVLRRLATVEENFWGDFMTVRDVK